MIAYKTDHFITISTISDEAKMIYEADGYTFAETVPQSLLDYIATVTAESLKAEIESAIQSMLDTKARELRYDNMMSARSYAGYANPFQVETQALATWCAECWIKAGELESSGVVYTVEEVIKQMPIYTAGV